MITLPQKYKSKDYFEHDYKKTMTDNRCTRCINSERRKKGLSMVYYCVILKKIVTPMYICRHFKIKPKRANNVINKTTYDNARHAKLREKERQERVSNNDKLLERKCICIKDYSTAEKGKIYYYKRTNSIIPSKLIFEMKSDVLKFIFRVENTEFNNYFGEV